MNERPNRLQGFLRENQKSLGIFALLALIFLVTGLVEPAYWGGANLTNMLRYVGLYGIIAIGVAFVIITGGIDLSIGAVIGLSGVSFAMLLRDGWLFFADPVSVPVAFLVVLLMSSLVGLANGLLITKLRLQPFLVTLCGLFIYRGLARGVGRDKTRGFANEFEDLKQGMVKGELFGFVPMSFVVLILIGVVAAVVLNKMTFGRYLQAMGRNKEAARFSGIKNDRMEIGAYVICSLLAGFGGIMFVLDGNSAVPSKFGNFFELYAIAGAVLGGCSLRGGEGKIAGVICGAALVQITTTAVFFLGVEDTYKFTVVGCLILVGVIVDQLLTSYTARRRALRAAL